MARGLSKIQENLTSVLGPFAFRKDLRSASFLQRTSGRRASAKRQPSAAQEQTRFRHM